jgi:hypothetical protein
MNMAKASPFAMGAVIPNPTEGKFDLVLEVMRSHHYSLSTE